MSSVWRGVIVVAFGAFLAAVFLPFAQGSSRLDVMDSLNRMYIPLRDRSEKPVFTPVEKGKEDQSATVVEYGSTGLLMEFAPDLADREMERAIKAQFPGSVSEPAGGRLRFHGWRTEREAVQLPYRWVLATSVLSVFAGFVLIIHGLAGQQAKQPAAQQRDEADKATHG